MDPSNRRILERRPAAFHGWYTRNAIYTRQAYDANFELFGKITTGSTNTWRRTKDKMKRNHCTRRTTKSNDKREGANQRQTRKTKTNANPNVGQTKPSPRGKTRTNDKGKRNHRECGTAKADTKDQPKLPFPSLPNPSSRRQKHSQVLTGGPPPARGFK